MTRQIKFVYSSPLAACRGACTATTFVDVRGCVLDQDTLAALAAVIGVPQQNVSGSSLEVSFPRFSTYGTSWECQSASSLGPSLATLAGSSPVLRAVGQLADLMGAPSLPKVAVGGLAATWTDLPAKHRLAAMLEVWLSVPATRRVGRVGTTGYVILDLGTDCGQLKREPLAVFLRSLWADADPTAVERVCDTWLQRKGRGGRVPVMSEKDADPVLPFQPEWQQSIVSGAPTN